jgi:hypothetical protein
VFLEINLALNPSTGILISTSRNWRKLQRVEQEFVLSSDGLTCWRHGINYLAFQSNNEHSGYEEADYSSPKNLTCIDLFNLFNFMERLGCTLESCCVRNITPDCYIHGESYIEKLIVAQLAKKIPCL